MATFSRRSTVSAPLSTVWAFHSTIDGLEALTPAAADLRVESLEIPSDGDELVAGSEMTLSVRTLPGLPRTRLRTRIVRRERRPDAALFVDELQDGPLTQWRHTHRFEARGDATELIDEIEFATGYGPVADAAFRAGLTVAFALRHRKTREILAGE
jgi:ligand-binding SRPBCC domain-containing protein